MSDRSLAFLRSAGWYPGRRSKFSSYEEVLKKEGVLLSAAQQAALAEFGGLRVDLPPVLSTSHPDTIEFDLPRFERRDFWRPWSNVYSTKVGEQVVICGVVEYLILMVGQSGKVYGAFDSDVYFVGATMDEALEVLIDNHDLRDLSSP